MKRRGPGRPPADADRGGRPRKTSEYPKLVVSIRPDTKALLRKLSAEMGKPIWRIVDDAIRALGKRSSIRRPARGEPKPKGS